MRSDIREKIAEYLQLMLPVRVPISTRAARAMVTFKSMIAKGQPFLFEPGVVRNPDIYVETARIAMAKEDILDQEALDHLMGMFGQEAADEVGRQIRNVGRGTTKDAVRMHELYVEIISKLPKGTLYDLQIALHPFYIGLEAAYRKVFIQDSGLSKTSVHAIKDLIHADQQTEEIDDSESVEAEFYYVRGQPNA